MGLLTLKFAQCTPCVLNLGIKCSLYTMLFTVLLFELLAPIVRFISYFIFHLSYVQPRSCSPLNLSSLLFSWFSHLHLILYAEHQNFSVLWPCCSEYQSRDLSLVTPTSTVLYQVTIKYWYKSALLGVKRSRSQLKYSEIKIVIFHLLIPTYSLMIVWS
jgi:hypothetical protein